jgi:hypothetical protein
LLSRSEGEDVQHQEEQRKEEGKERKSERAKERFNLLSIRAKDLKNHIGRHGPSVGFKAMTVEDANELENSLNCECS